MAVAAMPCKGSDGERPGPTGEASLADGDRGRHLDRLTAIDASFLTNESSDSHMHVGAILIFEGRRPATSTWSSTCAGASAWCPASARSWSCRRWRPGGRSGSTTSTSTSPTTSAIPRCRTRAARTQLKRLAGRVFSQQLDRSKPLWELWLAQGLERDRFAILTKTHHAMVDGVSGVDIGTVLFDFEPIPEPAEFSDDWVPQPSPARPSWSRGG